MKMSDERLCVLVSIDEALALLESRAEDLSFYVDGIESNAHDINQKLPDEITKKEFETLKLGLERLRHVSFSAKDLLEKITETLEREKDVSE